MFGHGLRQRNGSQDAIAQAAMANAASGGTVKPGMEALDMTPRRFSASPHAFRNAAAALRQGREGSAPAVQPQAIPAREQFDYGGMQKQAKALGKPLPFDTGAALAALGSMLSGNDSAILQYHQGRQALQQDRFARSQALQSDMAEYQWKDAERREDAALAASRPRTIGRNLVSYDPASGEAATLYDGAEDFELYAEELGLKPGSDDYFQAVEDFVLKGSGPSAHQRDLELDDYRTGNDAELERLRYGNRVGLENLRQSNRGAMEDQRQGNRMEIRRTPPAARPSAATARPRATNDKGETVEWNGKSWVRVR